MFSLLSKKNDVPGMEDVDSSSHLFRISILVFSIFLIICLIFALIIYCVPHERSESGDFDIWNFNPR
jgi:hypothetical protein